MDFLDGAARGSTITMLIVMSIVLVRDNVRVPSARAGVAFFFTIAAYLAVSSPVYVQVRGLDAVLRIVALAAPAAFWLFSRALFDDEGALTWRDASVVMALIVTGFLRAPTGVGQVATIGYYGGAVLLVGVALNRVARGSPSDLVEPRRRLRAVFTAVVGFEILAVLGAEALLAGHRPRLLESLKSTAALWLTALFAVWFLMPRRELFADEPPPSPPAPTAAGPAEDARSRERLLSLMRNEKVYRQESLTIGALARRLDLPEYRLRRIINRQLGHRNFNAFLNEFRVEDACRILEDPANERLPILNLALDLGYGSSGPFNRAFRARTGQTPTEYRRSKLSSSSPAP